MLTPTPPPAGSPLAGRNVRVGVYDSEAKAYVADVTLPPGSSVIVGSDTGCTVPVHLNLGIDRLEVVDEEARLHFAPGMRLHLAGDDPSTAVKGEASELAAQGIESPAPIRWTRISLRVRPTLSVLVRYVPDDGARGHSEFPSPPSQFPGPVTGG